MELVNCCFIEGGCSSGLE